MTAQQQDNDPRPEENASSWADFARRSLEKIRPVMKGIHEALDPDKLADEIERSAKGLEEGLTEMGREFRQIGGDIRDGTSRTVHRGIDAISSKPDTKEPFAKRIANLALKLAPVISGTKEYADAKQLYRIAKETEDAELTRNAQARVALALANSSFDVVVFASAGLVGRGAFAALKALAKVRFAASLPDVQDDVLLPLADRSLVNPIINRVTKRLLELEPATRKYADTTAETDAPDSRGDGI